MRIVIFGDSIAAGAFDVEQHGWVSRLTMYQYKRILESCWTEGDSIVNASVNGHTSTDLLARLPDEYEARLWKDEPVAVLLAIGINDSAIINDKNEVSLEQFESNLETIIDSVQSPTTKIIITGLTSVYEALSLPWCYDNSVGWSNAEIQKYNAVLQAVAERHHLQFIDLCNILDRSSEQHLPDGLHPNAEGHRLIYERVKAELEKSGIL